MGRRRGFLTLRIPRIYHPEPLTSHSHIALCEDAANHIGRVLRMGPGQALQLFDDSNQVFDAEITSASKKSVEVKVLEGKIDDRESPLHIHLGQVMSRGEKMEFTIQKSIELGVSLITPLFSERCGVKLDSERLNKKLQQWQKIAIAACEQCVNGCANWFRRGSSSWPAPNQYYSPAPSTTMFNATTAMLITNPTIIAAVAVSATTTMVITTQQSFAMTNEMFRSSAYRVIIISNINIKKDSSFAMLLEAQRRGYELHYMEMGRSYLIRWRSPRPYPHAEREAELRRVVFVRR